MVGRLIAWLLHLLAADEVLPMVDSLPNVPGLSEMAPSFLAAFAAMAAAAGVDADHLAAVVSNESRFRPDAENPDTHAIGLIQFMPSTAALLGTSTDELRRLSATEQLPYVAKFFGRYLHQLAPRDVYLAVFWPAAIGKPDETTLFEEGSIGYTQNRGLDRDHDGRITAGDVRGTIEAILVAAALKPRLVVGVHTTGAPSAPGSSGAALVVLLVVAIIGGLAAWPKT